MPCTVQYSTVQWNPSCEATPFVPEKWPFKRGSLSSRVKINTFMFRFTVSSGLSRGVDLSSGLSLKRGSTVYKTDLCYYMDEDYHKESHIYKFYWIWFVPMEKSIPIPSTYKINMPLQCCGCIQ